MDMRELFHRLIDSGDLTCADRIDLPARQERTTDIPIAYRSGLPGRWLTNDDKLKGRLWLHQARAMEAAEQGRNVVISTGTASGKSLVFQSVVLRALDKNDEATAIVFYPLKALAGDQLVSWRRTATLAGLGEDSVQKIDGGIKSIEERETRLERARIALMTPDICQSWLLREISKPARRDFLARMSLIVVDEAHILESVFGSNFAYLFRRLCAARSLARPERQLAPLQSIAASATILKPDSHLHDLTGLRFDVIGQDDDGSPHHSRSIVHVGADNNAVMDVIGSLLRRLVDETEEGNSITFVDSRQGTERLVVKVDREDSVKSYRSGYEADDRKTIEDALRSGDLRGVVSTSALELGIDISHFTVGLNFGVPPSRKSLRQRLGRVGRQRPGSFGIVAESSAFRRFGMTLGDYYQASIEPSYLYLHNRFIQYAHARCLVEELEMLGVARRRRIPSNVSWPDGFKEIFEFSHPEGRSAQPKEFDSIARIGGDSPHLNYLLRNVPEEAFNIAHGRGDNPVRIGQLNLQQAIREAFPGAIYLHMAPGWYVREWRSTAFGRSIRVSRTGSHSFPKPIIRTFVNFGLGCDGLIENHFRRGGDGFLAECHLEITERVEGFVEQGERKFYRDLRQENPSMAPKMRKFRTTGTVIRIKESWFREKGVKQKISEALHELMLREYSILPQDIGRVSTNIALIRNGQLEHVSDAIVVYDALHGSLRLTERAYLKFDHLLDRFQHSVEISHSEDNLLSLNLVSKLRQWFEELGEEGEADLKQSVPDSLVESDGWLRVFAVGSIVARKGTQGVYGDIEISGYQLLSIDGEKKFFYRYNTGTTGSALVSGEKVEAVGGDWSMALWNPEMDEIRESKDDVED